MAYPQWPAGLPLPLRKRFRVRGKALPVQRTKMEAGPDRTIRTGKPIMREASCSVVLTEAQQVDFWRFFNVDGNAGADWVEIPLRVGNTVAVHRCRFLGYPGSVMVAPGSDEFSFSVETDQQVMV